MNPDDDTASVDDAQEQAAFGSGFEGKPAEKPTAKTEKPDPAETPRAKEEPKPEYVQITKSDWAEMRAAAAKTESYDQQLSRAFGTIGNLQKIVNEVKAQTPRDLGVKMPAEAFVKMAKDFPELAELSREEFQAALAGLKGPGNTEADEAVIKRILAEHTSAREIEALEDVHPDWRDIVGAVDVTKEQPNPDNPFRKWLATKDATYQARVNNTESAAVIARAIRSFQTETKATSKPTEKPRDDARADRIRAAVQPKGDGGGPAATNSREDAFAAGFGR